jgi:hypothetical protein
MSRKIWSTTSAQCQCCAGASALLLGTTQHNCSA